MFSIERLDHLNSYNLLIFGYMAVELDINSDIMPSKFPRIEVKPVIWHFDLIPINDFLFEDAISISQPIAPGGVVEGGEAVEEAGGKTTKTSISESSIVFLADNVFHTETELRETLWIK